ncbi:mesotocin-neurophysin MT-like [Amblyraja radiata]|uniref:mesotocin-neurophysin MT-like n=1 Tax=Amblyraja radiata TaxID=386614 RepID=UPI0014037585|nr:mesotocin-neurophysin MT-like [Amblyraja radiata]
MHSACLTVGLLFLVSIASACYISNCPQGGKRSIMDMDIRQCMSCGPSNRGQCFGEKICCGEEIGCFFGTSETLRCQKESYLLSPCEPAGRLCGTNGGKCAAAGTCCTAESCTLDPACNSRSIFSSD